MRAEQRIGIGADGVEGDVAKVEQAGETDNDIQAPCQHHIDQDLNAEIIDPFQRTLEADQHDDHDRIQEQNRDADRVEVAAHEAGLRGDCRSLGLLCLGALECRLREADIEEASTSGEEHHYGEQPPALHQDQLVGDVLVGLQADEQHEQAERYGAGIERLAKGTLDGAGDDVAFRRNGNSHDLRPFRLLAGPECRTAGRSARSPGWRRRRRPCSRWRNRPTTCSR